MDFTLFQFQMLRGFEWIKKRMSKEMNNVHDTCSPVNTSEKIWTYVMLAKVLLAEIIYIYDGRAQSFATWQ